MAETVGSNDVRAGMKVEIDGQPWVVVSADFVKPGKGQPFTRIKLKHLMTGRVIERTYKSGERVEVADIEESKMRFLYKQGEDAVFMDERTFEQITIAADLLEEVRKWMVEDLLYDIVIYKGQPVAVSPPTFMELRVVQTEPGLRGDTTGRVLKPAIVETGAKLMVPIFIKEDEVLRFDTRTGDYVSRVSQE